MRKPPKSAYEFSDDFEVTYEEDISSKYKVNPESDEDPRSGARAETITQPMPRVRNSRHYDLSIEDPDDGSDGYYDSRDDYDYEDDDYDRPGSGRRRGSRSDYRESVRPSHARRKRSRQTPIAAPIKKGGRTVYRISQTIFRNLSVILILAITGFMAYNFFRGSAPYGDIENAVVSQNYTLVQIGRASCRERV